jgi:hypothetical protein
VQQVASALSASKIPEHLQHASNALSASQTLAPERLQYTCSVLTPSHTTRLPLQPTSIHSSKILAPVLPPKHDSEFPSEVWVCEECRTSGNEAACFKCQKTRNLRFRSFFEYPVPKVGTNTTLIPTQCPKKATHTSSPLKTTQSSTLAPPAPSKTALTDTAIKNTRAHLLLITTFSSSSGTKSSNRWAKLWPGKNKSRPDRAKRSSTSSTP